MSRPTVIVPIFNAFGHVKSCLDSLERHSRQASILLINDSSTDEKILPLLEEWIDREPGRSLLNNEENRGFVYSANRGMSAVDGDVVLLNSDTQVSPGWLDALARCLATDESIATATPWSNNGEIVSFPELCVAAPVPEDLEKIAAIFQSVGQAYYPELPTAVGFCMAISRRAIDRVGYFDEPTFGLGYGEENDFCMRAAKAGMRNVLCDDAYVAHHGGASFSQRGLQPDSDSMQRLAGKHPEYESLVMEFIHSDPLAHRRMELAKAFKRGQGAIR